MGISGLSNVHAWFQTPHGSQDIVTIGEVLVDWVCLDKTLDLSQAQHFVKAPGGAPANVAVGLARLGVPVKFLGGRTDGLWGTWLSGLLAQEGVDMSLSPVLAHTNTRQVYVLTSPEGQRIFQGFTQHACADTALMPYHFEPLYVGHGRYPQQAPHHRLVYWGSVIQSHPPLAESLHLALQTLRTQRMETQHPTLLCYDPNYRAPLWHHATDALHRMRESFAMCDVLKISDDELPMFYPDMPLDQAGKMLLQAYPNITWLIVTCGKEGAWSIGHTHCMKVPSFTVEAIELTGAGDGFVAGLLKGILWYLHTQNVTDATKMLHAMRHVSEETAQLMLRCAAAVGALATLKPGAMSALPTLDALAQFIDTQNQS